MGIRKSVVTLLPGGAQGVEKPPEEEPEGEEEPEVEDTDGTNGAGLFNCASCGTTYISESMDACPDCETAVESIPSEVDLGMV